MGSMHAFGRQLEEQNQSDNNQPETPPLRPRRVRRRVYTIQWVPPPQPDVDQTENQPLDVDQPTDPLSAPYSPSDPPFPMESDSEDIDQLLEMVQPAIEDTRSSTQRLNQLMEEVTGILGITPSQPVNDLREGEPPVRNNTPATPETRSQFARCVVCLDGLPDELLWPCRHVTCPSCAHLLTTCPVCRKAIFCTYRIYF